MPRLLTIGILSALALPAMAQDAPRMAIVGLHQDGLDEAAQELAISKMAEAVDITGKADGLETNDVVKAITGREEVIVAEALLANGRQDLLSGKNLYNQAQTDEAISALQSAVEDLSLAVRSTNSVKELWEAWVYLGTAQLQKGEEEAGLSSFRAAAALNPDRNMNEALFPPDVVTAFKGQKTLLSKAAVTFNITTDGEATIFMDGREVGTGQVAVAGVYPGMHHVVAKGEGAHGYKLVRVEQAPDGKAPDVSLELGPPIIGGAADSDFLRSRQIAGLYRALGTHAQDVDLLLLAGTHDSQLKMQLYAPQSDAFSKPVYAALNNSAGDLAADTMPDLMAMVTNDGKILPESVDPIPQPFRLDANNHLASLLMDPREPQAQVVIAPNPQPTQTTKKKKSPVLPIVLGVVAAGAVGTGGYFGISALQGDQPRYGGTVVIGPLN